MIRLELGIPSSAGGTRRSARHHVDAGAVPIPSATPEELSDGIARVLTEVADVLASDRWAILDRGSEQRAHHLAAL
jgi:hypothetical protein